MISKKYLRKSKNTPLKSFKRVAIQKKPLSKPTRPSNNATKKRAVKNPRKMDKLQVSSKVVKNMPS